MLLSKGSKDQMDKISLHAVIYNHGLRILSTNPANGDMVKCSYSYIKSSGCRTDNEWEADSAHVHLLRKQISEVCIKVKVDCQENRHIFTSVLILEAPTEENEEDSS